jgi:hypothetical protein
MAQFDLAIVCIHQHSNAPGQVRPQIGHDKRRAIVQEQPDTLTRCQSPHDQSLRKALDLCIQLLIGNCLIGKKDGRAIWLLLCVLVYGSND